jgi:hypothetical protein
MKLAMEDLPRKPSTALRIRSFGSIMERSIVGEGGFFFDFFPRRLVLIPAMMMVTISWRDLSSVGMVTLLDQMKRQVPRNKVGGESAGLIQYDLLVVLCVQQGR